MDFSVYVIDEAFDNDDNPYGRMRVHLYTNMNNKSDISQENPPKFKDIEIPLELCSNQKKIDWT